MAEDIVLETQGLSKEFKGFVAVSQVDLRVRRGTIHALIGPNGAGKTTCFNLLTKFLVPTAGRIVFDGIDITAESPAHVARRGVIRSFQISAVFPHMTVLENVRVALQRRLGSSFQFWKSERTLSVLDARALELLAAVDLERYAASPAVELSYGRKRALEIATTLAMDPVLMVEHNMSVVASIADTITVLQRGAVLAEGPYEQVSKNPAVIEAYMGSGQGELQGAH